MSFYIEVYYASPKDIDREKRISKIASDVGGQLTFWDKSASDASRAICLTYEFANLSAATKAADRMRNIGEHVEGPADYGGPE